MRNLMICSIVLIICLPGFSQVPGFFDDFEDGSLDTTWDGSTVTLWKADHPNTFGLSESKGVLNIAYTRTAESGQWDNFNFTPPENVTVDDNPVVVIKIKSDVANTFTVKPIYTNGSSDWLQQDVPADELWHVYEFNLVEANYTGATLEKIYLYLDGGSTELKNGTVQLDDFQIAGFTIEINNLQAEVIDSSKVDLTWEINDNANLDHYNIYRSTQFGFSMNEVNKIGESTETLYHDSELSNSTTYYYKVTAVDITGREHAPSSISIRTFMPGAPPTVTVASVNAEQVGKYGKFEVIVNMENASYENPYNPDELDLYAWFYAPDGDSVKMNGFYDNYQNVDQWKIRFAADQVGTWQYKVFAKDLDGTGFSDPNNFTVVASDNKGWLHISPNNSNYLMHDDGTSFYGISVYYPWNVTENRLDDFADVNGNFFGYWDCTYDNAGNGGGKYLLESMESGVGYIDQRKAARIDEVIGWAENRDMKIMLAIWVHGFLRVDGIPWDNGKWYEQNPYSRIVEVGDFYTDSLALSYQAKHHRYMIARWGYSQALGVWEILNEVHGTTGWVESQEKAKKWVEGVHDYFKENDPFQRPTTASFGGGDGASHFTTEAKLGDIPNVHFYEEHGWPNMYPDNIVRSGLMNVVSESKKLKSKGDRPAYFGEAGYTSMLADVNSMDYTWEFHNAFWGSLTNGLASTPFWWEFNSTQIFTPVRLNDYMNLNEFVENIDFAHLNLTSSEITAENVDGYFMGADSTGFGWMKKYNDSDINETAYHIPKANMNNGNFLVEWFNTWTGNIIDYDTTVVVGQVTWGDVTSQIEQEDVAFKMFKLDGGRAATQVKLHLTQVDTLLPGKYPWSEMIDSVMYYVVCYVTDDANQLDITYHKKIDFTIEGGGELEVNSINAQEGGIVLKYNPNNSSSATITATAEEVGSSSMIVEILSDVTKEDKGNMPTQFELKDNYPNPFNGTTTIEYSVPKKANVKLTIYNNQGQFIETLVDENKSAGYHCVRWNAANYASGVYYYHLVSDEFSQTKKILFMK